MKMMLKLPMEPFKDALAAVLRGSVASLRLRKKKVGSKIFFLGEGPWRIGESPDPKKEVPFFAAAILTTRSLPDLKRASAGQTMIELIVSTAQPDRLQAIVHDAAGQSQLAELKLIGPGMVTLVSSEATVPEARDQKTLARIKPVQGAARGSWSQSCHVVVGAGSGGSCLATQIAAQAPASLILVDPDKVKRHNVLNLPPASEQDATLNRPKVNVLAKRLIANSNDLHIAAIAQRIQELEVRDYLEQRDPSVIWSFVDEPAAHLACAFISREIMLPHLAIGTAVTENPAGYIQHQCDVRLLLPGQGCARCVPMIEPPEYEALLYEVRRPRGCLRRGQPRRWNDRGRIGSSLSTNEVAAGFAVLLYNRFLQGLVTTSVWLRYLTGPRGEGQLFESSVGAHPDCQICNSVG